MEEPITVTIQPYGLRKTTKRGQSLFNVILEAGINLNTICGGVGTCGKCRIMITKGRSAVNKPTKAELGFFSAEEMLSGVRLACQTEIQGSVEVYIPLDSVVTELRLQTEGIETKVKPTPLVKKYYLELSKPTLQSLESDFERLTKHLHEFKIRLGSIPLELLKELPEVLRGADWKVTATVWSDREVLDVEKGNNANACYGIAVDVGTTKIAMFLLNLTTGKTINVSSLSNPQIRYGEDVISRISYAMKGPKEMGELQNKVIDGINDLVIQCCLKANVNPRNVYEMTIVGNTAMHHLLLGINPKNLALSPYVPVIKGSLNIKAKELNLAVNPYANIHFLPVIAGFVGSDCVADILATGLFREKDACLLLDIGTNTEVVIGNQKHMMAASCASGPAFEGAHIKHGMKASSGAIESVRIDQNTLEVSFRTINNAKPKGICGSGIIDAIAEMLKARIIGGNGAIHPVAGSHHIRVDKGGRREFVLTHREDPHVEDIVVTQEDIREIQLAKAAIRTGISILMQEMDIAPEQIKRIYIAGAFGTYINPASAKTIGMIPDVPLHTILSVGNTAGSGARMALLSGHIRKISEKISESVEYLELAAHPKFQSVFVESLRFPV